MCNVIYVYTCQKLNSLEFLQKRRRSFFSGACAFLERDTLSALALVEMAEHRGCYRYCMSIAFLTDGKLNVRRGCLRIEQATVAENSNAGHFSVSTVQDRNASAY